MLEKDKNTRFTKHLTQLKVPFAIYADFQSTLKKVQKIKRNNPNESYTDKYQVHIACSHGHKVVCTNEKFCKPVQTYHGENALHRLMKKWLKC